MEDNKSSYLVRAAYLDEWQEAMGLAWRTFLKFEAPDYPPEGVRSFNDFITDSTLYKMFVLGTYQMFVACADGKMVGMITLRNECHISLLFVDEKYHRQGIGRALIRFLCDYLITELNVGRLTVNASPYGTGFYHRLGFTDLGPQAQKDGITYTPMEFIL